MTVAARHWNRSVANIQPDNTITQIKHHGDKLKGFPFCSPPSQVTANLWFRSSGHGSVRLGESRAMLIAVV